MLLVVDMDVDVTKNNSSDESSRGESNKRAGKALALVQKKLQKERESSCAGSTPGGESDPLPPGRLFFPAGTGAAAGHARRRRETSRRGKPAEGCELLGLLDLLGLLGLQGSPIRPCSGPIIQRSRLARALMAGPAQIFCQLGARAVSLVSPVRARRVIP